MTNIEETIEYIADNAWRNFTKTHEARFSVLNDDNFYLVHEVFTEAFVLGFEEKFK
jgi:hypothetical protein